MSTFQQDPDQLVVLVQQWISDVSSGRRPGKQYLVKNGIGFDDENSSRILDYCTQNYHVVNFETLDKTLNLLARSNRLVGFETPISSGDISAPAPSRGSLSLESSGSLQDVITRVLNKRVAAETSAAADETARHAGYKPLPNRELTESEMKNADPRALRDWLNRRRGSDTAKIQD